jgi:hypothetical protein
MSDGSVKPAYENAARKCEYDATIERFRAALMRGLGAAGAAELFVMGADE